MPINEPGRRKPNKDAHSKRQSSSASDHRRAQQVLRKAFSELACRIRLITPLAPQEPEDNQKQGNYIRTSRRASLNYPWSYFLILSSMFSMSSTIRPISLSDGPYIAIT